MNNGYVEARFPLLSCWCDLTDGVRSWQVILFPLPFHAETTKERWKFCSDGHLSCGNWQNLLIHFQPMSLSLLAWAWFEQCIRNENLNIPFAALWPFWWPYLWPWINKGIEKQNGPNGNNLFSICNVSLKTLIQAFLLPPLKMQPWLKYCTTLCNIPANSKYLWTS